MSFELVVLNVGQGDATLVRLPELEAFGLIDFGPRAHSEAVVQQVQRLVSSGEDFAFAAVTHWDADHVGALIDVFDVQEPSVFLTSSVALETFEALLRRMTEQPALQALERVRNSATRRIRAGLGNVVELNSCPGLRLHALSPDSHVEDEIRELLESSTRSDDEKLRHLRRHRNRSSLSLYLERNGASAVICGEIETEQYDTAVEAIQAFISPYRAPRVLRIGHHGSRNNYPEALFPYTAPPPLLGLISAGGQYGHPHPHVLERLEQEQVTVACTNLGHPCLLLQRQSQARLRGEGLRHWLTTNGTAARKPLQPPLTACHSTIRVVVEASHGNARFESQPASCPFTGAPDRSLIVK